MNEKDKLGKNGIEPSPLQASRARNRTVMLSSDVTGQMRALIQGGNTDNVEEEENSPNSGFVAPTNFGKGFGVPSNGGGDTVTELHTAPVQTHGQSFESNHLDIDFPSVNRRNKTEMQERPVSTTMHDIRKSKELLAGNVCATEASHSLNNAVTSFDHEREQLTKARIGFKKSRIFGFLISFDQDENGEILEVREGRSIVTSRFLEQADILLVEDSSVSNPHAVIKADKKGNIMLLDQLSEMGSGVIRSGQSSEIDAVGNPVDLKQGDIVRFGSRYFIYCAVPKIAIQD